MLPPSDSLLTKVARATGLDYNSLGLRPKVIVEVKDGVITGFQATEPVIFLYRDLDTPVDDQGTPWQDTRLQDEIISPDSFLREVLGEK